MLNVAELLLYNLVWPKQEQVLLILYASSNSGPLQNPRPPHTHRHRTRTRGTHSNETKNIVTFVGHARSTISLPSNGDGDPPPARKEYRSGLYPPRPQYVAR